MSAFDWHVMRNRIFTLALLVVMLSFSPLRAAEPDANIDVAQPRPRSDLKEYLPQALPDDVFTPSEEASEDYPLPFPVDI